MIPFNKPYMTGRELDYIRQAVDSGKLSGDGIFTGKCHAWLEQKLGSGRAYLTSSCTDALEAAALLCNLQPGDEVIIPSFTFVSTANAFALRGANIRFIDSCEDHPNMDINFIEGLITNRTKAIVPVHYAGMACDMERITDIAYRHNLFVIEDAAQAIDSYYRGRALGTFGNMATFSFHETKNVICGEGGSLHINDSSLVNRTEIIREKGTNRSSFFRGEVDKYGWVDIGSSYLPSEITAAFLYAQFEAFDIIQARRLKIWESYRMGLTDIEVGGDVVLPKVPDYASNNGHMFYLVCPSLDVRTKLIKKLKAAEIMAVFHYQSLHSSYYYAPKHDGRVLPNADRYTNCLLRLPLYYELTDIQVENIIRVIREFFGR